MSFGEKLRIKREEKGLSQSELGDIVGIEQASISKFENGSKLPNVVNGVLIATVLGTTCEDLVFGEDVFKDKGEEV